MIFSAKVTLITRIDEYIRDIYVDDQQYCITVQNDGYDKNTFK